MQRFCELEGGGEDRQTMVTNGGCAQKPQTWVGRQLKLFPGRILVTDGREASGAESPGGPTSSGVSGKLVRGGGRGPRGQGPFAL